MVMGLGIHGFLAHIGLTGWSWVLEYRPDLDKVVDSYCGPSVMAPTNLSCPSDPDGTARRRGTAWCRRATRPRSRVGMVHTPGIPLLRL